MDPWRSKNGSQTTSRAPSGTLPWQPSSRSLSQMTFCSESIAPAESKSTSRRPRCDPGPRSPPPLKKLFWKAFTYPAKRTLLSLGGPTRRAPGVGGFHWPAATCADPSKTKLRQTNTVQRNRSCVGQKRPAFFASTSKSARGPCFTCLEHGR